MSAEPAVILITDYDGLVAACRARADQLNISRDTIDEVAGLPKGYTSKALMAEPFGGKSATGGRLSSRNLGRVSLGPMLGALGIALVVVEDPEAMARTVRRRSARNKSQVRMLTGGKHSGVTIRLSVRHMKKLAKLATAARAKKIPRWKRIRIAKQAARARWKREAVSS